MPLFARLFCSACPFVQRIAQHMMASPLPARPLALVLVAAAVVVVASASATPRLLDETQTTDDTVPRCAKDSLLTLRKTSNA